MKSSEFRGFTSVLKFTLTQTLKQKTYVVSLIIMMLFSIGAFPVMKLINKTGGDSETIDIERGDNSDNAEELQGIKQIYLLNETNIESIPFDQMSKDYLLSPDTKIVQVNDTVDNICKRLEDGVSGAEKNSVLLHAILDMETGGYEFKIYYAAESEVEEDVYMLSGMVENWFTDYKTDSVGVSKDTIDSISAQVSTEVIEYEDFVKTDSVEMITENEYNVVYAVMMIFYMVIVLTASMVSNKVVEEKANRIVEYLMTNVRPLALMLGKIVAMLIAGVGEVVLIIVSGYASYLVSEKIWPSEGSSMMSGFLSVDGLKHMGAFNVVLCIIIMIIGVFMYSLIAALFAASVSKMEEVQQGLKIFTIIILVAFLATMIAANLMWSFGINAYVKVIMFVPITSVMLLPGILLIGKAAIFEIIISIALMLVTTVLLLWFVSLIYENVIVMNGSVVSLKTMISMAKDSLDKKKGGASHEE